VTPVAAAVSPAGILTQNIIGMQSSDLPVRSGLVVTPICANFVEGIVTHDVPELDAFPNPAKNVLILSNVPKSAHALLWDANGKLVLDQALPIGTAQINVSNFSAGLYLLKIVAGAETVASKKIIVE
jgi:hypothetical protein